MSRPRERYGRNTYAWQKLRAQILAEHPMCFYCRRRPATQVDHWIPLSKGGALLDPENCRPSCRPCNEAKGNDLPWHVPVATRTGHPHNPCKCVDCVETGRSRHW